MVFRFRQNAISVKKKVEILRDVEKGIKKSDIAAEFKIPRSTLSSIIKDKPKILKAYNSQGVNNKRNRLRKSKWPELDKALTNWISQARNRNLPLSGPLLKEKAEEFATRLQIEDFKVSEGWLTRFKQRNNLTFRKVCGEAASVNHSEANTWKSGRLKEILNDYSPNDIFNADETGLFFKQLPNSTIAFKDDKCVGGKLSKERLTVLVCTNMSGTDKIKPLVIGKFKKPRCFKGVRSLPVTYKHSKKAWMTTEIFVSWVRDLDAHFLKQKRKIILLVDNCTAHCDIEDLKAIKLEFLPPNATEVLQPCDQGIILILKKYYRQRLLRRMLLCMDNQKDYEVDILKAIYLLHSAWESVDSETIVNCFHHAGFISTGVSSEKNTHDIQLDKALEETVNNLKEHRFPFPQDWNIKAYVEMDEDLAVCSEMTEDCIADDIIKSRTSNDTDDEDASEPLRKPSRKEVINSLQTLKTYLSMEDNSEQVLGMLNSVEEFALQMLSKNLRQMKIDNYFQSF